MSQSPTSEPPDQGATEVWFYHLEHLPLERVLPSLIEKTLARGWQAVVQAGSQERLDALDDLLWTYRDDSFLPHATEKDGDPVAQPVFLTTGDDNPSGAAVRFLVDGAETSDLTGYARLIYLFDGNDPEAVEQARAQWRAASAADCTVTYWQQSPNGGWEKKG